MKLVEFIFSGFWTFLGCVLWLIIFERFVVTMYSRTWRYWNIRKHGYPPPHCDADGFMSKNELLGTNFTGVTPSKTTKG